MYPLKVTLTESDMDLAAYVGESRYAFNRRNGVTERKMSPRDGEQLAIEGAAGEVAFARHMKLHPNMVVDEAEREEYTVLGLTIDVKWSGWRGANPDMLTPLRKARPDKRCDLYFLITGQAPEMWMQGHIGSWEFMETEEFHDDVGRGMCFKVPYAKLDKRELTADILMEYRRAK